MLLLWSPNNSSRRCRWPNNKRKARPGDRLWLQYWPNPLHSGRVGRETEQDCERPRAKSKMEEGLDENSERESNSRDRRASCKAYWAIVGTVKTCFQWFRHLYDAICNLSKVRQPITNKKLRLLLISYQCAISYLADVRLQGRYGFSLRVMLHCKGCSYFEFKTSPLQNVFKEKDFGFLSNFVAR